MTIYVRAQKVFVIKLVLLVRTVGIWQIVRIKLVGLDVSSIPDSEGPEIHILVDSVEPAILGKQAIYLIGFWWYSVNKRLL